MPLNPKTRQALKAKAHSLKPVILIGAQGLTPAVNQEIDRALNDHELIKIRIHTEDRDMKNTIFQQISLDNHAEKVQVIGKIGVFYRKRQN